jgi:hypothetical protein
MSRFNDISPEFQTLLEIACRDDATRDELAKLEELVLDQHDLSLVLDFFQLDGGLQRFAQQQVAVDKCFQMLGFESSKCQQSVRLPELSESPRLSWGFSSPPIRSMLGFFSASWPMAYLVATVIVGLGIAIAGVVCVSDPTYIATHPQPVIKQQRTVGLTEELVGRITGMVDCQWVDGSMAAINGQRVSLRRKYALSSGLMEITYDTGAKVILQGPITYEVDGHNGGFLSSGKLIGRVEVEAAKGFSVRTPATTVTDLGTEFGVEVRPDGAEDVVVLQGQVRVVARGVEGAAAKGQTLRAGQSAQINGRTAMIVVGSILAESSKRFVRALPTLASPQKADVAASDHLVLWLKADAIRGLDEGAPVGRWNDSSSRHNHMYHFTSELPIYVSGAKSGLNNMPVVRFKGKEMLCGILDVDPRTPGVQPLKTPFTLLSVVKNAERGGNYVVRGYFGGGRTRMAFGMNHLSSHAPNDSFWAWTPGELSTYGQANSIDAKWNIHGYLVPDMIHSHWRWYRNGVVTGSVGMDSGKPQEYGETVYVGGSGNVGGYSGDEYWIGDVAELLLYEGVLTDSELSQVGDYLARKYAIPTTWKKPEISKSPDASSEVKAPTIP